MVVGGSEARQFGALLVVQRVFGILRDAVVDYAAGRRIRLRRMQRNWER